MRDSRVFLSRQRLIGRMAYCAAQSEFCAQISAFPWKRRLLTHHYLATFHNSCASVGHLATGSTGMVPCQLFSNGQQRPSIRCPCGRWEGGSMDERLMEMIRFGQAYMIQILRMRLTRYCHALQQLSKWYCSRLLVSLSSAVTPRTASVIRSRNSRCLSSP